MQDDEKGKEKRKGADEVDIDEYVRDKKRVSQCRSKLQRMACLCRAASQVTSMHAIYEEVMAGAGAGVLLCSRNRSS
jgi:hypothetical protein